MPASQCGWGVWVMDCDIAVSELALPPRHAPVEGSAWPTMPRAKTTLRMRSVTFEKVTGKWRGSSASHTPAMT